MKALAVVVLLLGMAIISCEEDKQISACQFEDPLEDLTWLKNIKRGFEMSAQPAQSEIYQYTYLDSTVFLVDPCVGCVDDLVSVYNCDGEVICEFGGIAGLNTCEDFDSLATDRVKLYPSVCGDKIKEDADLYKKETDYFNIISASISGNCLNIEVGSSGCSGESWRWELVDSEGIMESYPVQRNIRLILENQEMCQAVFTQYLSFDLNPIRIDDYGEIVLNMEGIDQSLVYTYDPDKSFILNRSWDLVKVDGGMMPVEYNFAAGEITWKYSNDQVTITNNNTDDSKVDYFESGSYSLAFDESGGGANVIVDGQNLGYLWIQSAGEFWIDARAYDGNRLVFKSSQ